ncbi:MAG: hypothetical protein ACO1SX_12485 [Actinomycetota bacterium]
MLRLPITLGLVTLLTLAPALSAFAGSSGDLDRFLLTERDAVLIAPPEVVAAWDVKKAEWSPDGRFVLASRTFVKIPPIPVGRPDFRRTLILWNADERKNTEIWKGTPLTDADPQFGWVAGGSAAFALVRQAPISQAGQPPQPPREWVLRIDPRRPALRTLFEVKPDTTLHTSPRIPLAVLTIPQDRIIRVLRADGAVARQIPFPAGVVLHSPHWNADASRLHFTAFNDAVNPGAEPETVQAFDPRTGELSEVNSLAPEPAQSGAGLTVGDLRLRQSSGVIQQGSVHQRIAPLWLESAGTAEARALISPDAEWGKLSPRGDAVMYRSGGAVWVAPLARLSRNDFLRARGNALRIVSISNAKQLGLGVIIWASKNGDTLPSADQPVWDLIHPIVKSDALADGFVYTYPGGKLADVAKPSETLLGYVLGPGGRAEIWVDGHVTWKDD